MKDTITLSKWCPNFILCIKHTIIILESKKSEKFSKKAVTYGLLIRI